MVQIVEMPKLSDTMEEGGVSEWLKKEGEFVAEGDLLLAIDTDKATMEYASPEEGYLLKIIEQKGSQVSLGAPLAVMGEKGELFELSEILSPKQTAKKTTKAQVKKSVKTEENLVPQTSTERIKASPLAKKIAQENQLDLSLVSGSGPYGRIVARDVKVDQSLDSRALGHQPAKLQEKIIPHTMMRKTIAKRLSESKREAPHFYLTVSCRTGAIQNWKNLLNHHPEKSLSQKVSLNDVLLFICSRALMKHPEINSLWSQDAVTHCGSVDLSVAVALPDGLVTPVVKSCETKDIWNIAKELKGLVKKAKEKKLRSEDYEGGSFTLSNLGMTKVESFTAVINSPQTCILAVGRSLVEAVVKEDGNLAAEERMKLTLSCDHRAVDGYMGALFLETLVNYIENPLLLFS